MTEKFDSARAEILATVDECYTRQDDFESWKELSRTMVGALGLRFDSYINGLESLFVRTDNLGQESAGTTVRLNKTDARLEKIESDIKNLQAVELGDEDAFGEAFAAARRDQTKVSLRRQEKETLEKLWNETADFSQQTFGPDDVRGPLGPLKHLAKEVQEALMTPDDLEEYADLLLLVFDATRRAGFSFDQLVRKSVDKLEKNRQREWPDWRAHPTDAALEHKREQEDDFEDGSFSPPYPELAIVLEDNPLDTIDEQAERIVELECTLENARVQLNATENRCDRLVARLTELEAERDQLSESLKAIRAGRSDDERTRAAESEVDRLDAIRRNLESAHLGLRERHRQLRGRVLEALTVLRTSTTTWSREQLIAALEGEVSDG